jgi:hypothetical protein
VLMGQTATAAVAVVLPDLRKQARYRGAGCRAGEPGLDRVPAEAGMDVEHVDQPQPGVDRGHRRSEVMGPRLGEGVGPERVEVRTLVQVRQVGLKCIAVQVVQGYECRPRIRGVVRAARRGTGWRRWVAHCVGWIRGVALAGPDRNSPDATAEEGPGERDPPPARWRPGRRPLVAVQRRRVLPRRGGRRRARGVPARRWALNSGQVGATRAAQFIAARRGAAPVRVGGFTAAAEPVLVAALGLLAKATSRAGAGEPDNSGDLLREVGQLMSAKAGPVRSGQSIHEACVQVHDWLARYEDHVSADATSRRAVDRTFLVRDILTTAYVYLCAMADYTAHGGRSRGSVLYTDSGGSLPRVGHGSDASVELDLPEVFRFRLDGGSLDGEIQEAAWVPADDGGDPAGHVELSWRPVRPIPAVDDFFENTWREFREHRNIC